MNPESGLTLSHYRLVEKIGEGGMGVVWKAEDTVLGRTVAVKILPAALALDEERRSMFLDEARMASSVSHGNIVQVHEMGREGDLDFIVMEYIEGQTLSRLLHGRPVSAERIADWGLQIAQGLSRAHKKGLLHRDLKPANILVTPEGEAKIVDFGLATLFTPRGSTFSLTQPLEDDQERKIAGTLPYMSPEQVRGEKLDSRSDIFSFGTILYEMATGQRPFTGPTAPELAREIQECRPRPVHDLVPKVPVELHRIIEKALSRRPEDRYQGMGDMAVDLKRLARELESGSSPSYEELNRLLRPGNGRGLRWGIWGASVLAVAAAVVFLGPRVLDLVKGHPSLSPSSVAVLPFTGSGAAASRPASFTDEVTGRLSRIAGLEVLSPVATQQYAGTHLDPGRIGRELHVASILAGSIQEGEGGEWVSVHLVSVDEESDIWAGRFQLSAGGMSTIQDSIVTGVSSALGIVSASNLVMPVSPRWMKNQQAYAYFLAGMERYLSGLSPHSVAAARAWLDRSLASDPGYAPALAMEGELAAQEWSWGDDVLRPGRMKKAHELVDQALDLDPTLAVALLAKGRVLCDEERWKEAIESGEQALRASPGSGYTYRLLSVFYEAAGDYGKAIETAKKGIATDDTRPRAYRALSRYYRETWDFDRAERTLREGLRRFPEDPHLVLDMADFLESQDRGQEALQLRREGLAKNPDNYRWYVNLMGQLRGRGRGAEADSVARALRDRFPNEPKILSRVGSHFLQRGDLGKGKMLFEKALQLEPYLQTARRNLAGCFEKEERYGSAEAEYRKSVTMVPDDPEPLQRLALFLERRDRFDEAEKLLVERSRRWPGRLSLMLDVARFYNRRKRYDVGEKWTRKAMEVAPDSWLPYNHLGWECWNQERFGAARDAFLESIRRLPDAFNSYQGLARSMLALSLPDSAETVMETWVRKRPGHAGGWLYLGWVYQENGKMNQAAAAYEKDLELRPRSAPTLNNLALLYGHMGRWEKEVEMYKRAIAIDSTNAVPWINLAGKYHMLDDEERAWAAADKASRLAKDNDFLAAGNNLLLAQIEKHLGKDQESKRHLALAQDRIARALQDHPLEPEVLAHATSINGFAGNVEKARQYATEAFRRQTGDPQLIYSLACGLALAGDREGGFEYLQKAVAAGYADRRALQDDPDLDGIRDDPRFADVLDSVH